MVDISRSQLCQSFDPMMVLPEKTYGFINHKGKVGPNTSCLAPAFVYLEGSRGKRYLCDFHYEYEKKITSTLTPDLWPGVVEVLVDNRDTIIDTFGEIDSEVDYLAFGSCWCSEQGTVRSLLRSQNHLPDHEKNSLYRYMCNFHFRKTYYRLLSNGRSMLDNEIINDGRKFFNVVPSIEASRLRIEQI